MIEDIIEIAREAGAVIMACRKDGFTVETKKDAFDFVTTADRKAEAFILEKLHAHYPKDAVLSEETSAETDTRQLRVWMVDPMDGTKDFKEGGDGFSVMIGLCIRQQPILGVVYAPAKDVLYYAERGKGAFKLSQGKQEQLSVSTIRSLAQARMVMRISHGEHRPSDALIESFAVAKKIHESSVGLKLGLIASGLADLNIGANKRAHKWDICAPQIILEEAGGQVTDMDGNPIDYGKFENALPNGFVATNGLLHGSAIKAIKGFYVAHENVR